MTQVLIRLLLCFTLIWAQMGLAFAAITPATSEQTAALLSSINRDVNAATIITRDTSFKTGNMFVDVGAALDFPENSKKSRILDGLFREHNKDILKSYSEEARNDVYNLTKNLGGKSVYDADVSLANVADALIQADRDELINSGEFSAEAIDATLKDPAYLQAVYDNAAVLKNGGRGYAIIEDTDANGKPVQDIYGLPEHTAQSNKLENERILQASETAVRERFTGTRVRVY